MLAAQKDALHRLGRLGLVGQIGVVQLGERSVQHLLGQSPREGFQHGIHVFALGQTLAGLGQFHFAPGIGLLVDLADERLANDGRIWPI